MSYTDLEAMIKDIGELTVDVNAPAGTRVRTSTEGDLFKKTEVSRQTQMVPTASGREE